MSLAVNNLSWTAGGHMVLDGVTLEARPGRMLGLLGPNGSGKSSLLRLIAGLRRATPGVVTLDGAPIETFGRQSVARRMALVEQQAATEARVTVEDVIRLGRVPYRSAFACWSTADEAAVSAAIGRLDLVNRRKQLWHSLSGGERQRVQIARALAQSPRELLLDEPTNHLDIRHQLDLLQLLATLPLTVVVAIHDLNLAARFCPEVALLHEGRLVAAGTPASVLTAQNILTVFEVAVTVTRSTIHSGVEISYLDA
jgi:iron complex transport system ATP-binding protein